jgi:large subunit ribosomal protein L30e
MDEIKKLIETKRTIFGTKITLKKLKNNLIEKIFLAKNCSEPIKKDIEHLAKISNVEIINLNLNNTELGTFCKKPFSISVVGVIKQ